MRHVHRVASALATAGCGALLLHARWAEAAHASPCGVKELRYSYTNGTASYSDAVKKLTTTAASCATAQSVAGAVAKDLLHKTKVPATLDGLAVKVTNPCAGCTPLWRGTATGVAATATFAVMGGAKQRLRSALDSGRCRPMPAPRRATYGAGNANGLYPNRYLDLSGPSCVRVVASGSA